MCLIKPIGGHNKISQRSHSCRQGTALYSAAGLFWREFGLADQWSIDSRSSKSGINTVHSDMLHQVVSGQRLALVLKVHLEIFQGRIDGFSLSNVSLVY